MKLLLFCPHFRPDLHAATGEVMTKLVEALAERDHEISVVTSLPWYRGHQVAEEWRGRPWRTERTDWGRIIRVWPFPTEKTNIRARAFGFGGFTSLATGLAVTLGRHDVVMGMSPPVFLGDAAWLLARRWRAPFVFNTQDIFPDVALDLGALSSGRIVDLARRHERSLYRRADAVTVLSEDQARNVGAKIGDDRVASEKIHIIHNFVDTDRIRPTERENPYRERHGLTGKTVVMYSGNVGLSQSFGLVRAAARRLAARKDVVFVINGEGAGRADVDRWAGPMANVRTIDFGPRSEISDILGAADIHLILLRGGLARSSTPSKFYGIMAAGRPVLASIDEGSEVAKVVKEVEVGRAVPPDDEWAFCQALQALLANRGALTTMGERGRRFACTWLTPVAQAKAYERLFHSLLKS